MPWSRRLFLSFLGLGFVSATACQRREGAIAPLTIGILAPLTGEAAPTDGPPTVQAAQLAVQEINTQGGIVMDGQARQLEVVVGDSTDRPDQAVANARQLLSDHELVAMLGLPLSQNAIPVAQFLDTVPLPMLSTTSTNPETTAGKRHIFRVGFVDDFQGLVLAQFAREELQATRAALLFDVASVYNRGLAATFSQAFTELGGTVVAEETYTGDRADDFKPQLQRIQAANPEVLLLPNYINDVAVQTQQAQELGLDIAILGGDAWDDFRLDPQAHFEGAYYTTMWYPDRTQTVVEDFLNAYEAAYGDTPNVNAVLAYDAVYLLAQALQSQTTTSPDAVRQRLVNLQDFRGVSGTISFSGTGDPQRTVFILQIQDQEATLAQSLFPS